jgi:hypothetical protein
VVANKFRPEACRHGAAIRTLFTSSRSERLSSVPLEYAMPNSLQQETASSFPSSSGIFKKMQLGWAWYRLVLVVALVLVFSFQKFVEVRHVLRLPGLFEIENVGRTKLALGICISILLFALLLEFVSLAIARRIGQVLPPLTSGRTTIHSLAWYRFAIFLVAGIFLFGNLQSRLLSGYIQAIPASPPLGVAMAWLAAWSVFAVASLWAKPASRIDVAGFVCLILLTRIYAYCYHSFTDIGGDMLSTIDRSQDLLLRGEFPYIDAPKPAMPYWPGTFLLYTLPELAGWDYRVMNLIVEVATVLVAGCFGANGRLEPGSAAVARMALPLFMVFPSCTFYSAETQYPLSSLVAVLFCRSLTSLDGKSQAVALGVAVAVNQTFGVLGLFTLPFWVRRYGLRSALRFTGIALLTCFVIISPFVVWNAKEFFRVTLLSLNAFSTAQLAGRFSLRPFLEGLSPHASEMFLAAAIAVVIAINYSRRINRSRAAATVTLGYCLFLFGLHRTFSHYFLPVIAMILSIPYYEESDPGDTPML